MQWFCWAAVVVLAAILMGRAMDDGTDDCGAWD